MILDSALSSLQRYRLAITAKDFSYTRAVRDRVRVLPSVSSAARGTLATLPRPRSSDTSITQPRYTVQIERNRANGKIVNLFGERRPSALNRE